MKRRLTCTDAFCLYAIAACYLLSAGLLRLARTLDDNLADVEAPA